MSHSLSAFVISYCTTQIYIHTKKALQLGCCAAWCCCSTISSVLSSWCGNEKSCQERPSPTSGRKRSVTLVVISICLQLLFQFVLAPYILDNLSSNNVIRNAWLDGCQTVSSMGVPQNDNDDTTITLGVRSCVSIAGNFRVSAVTFFFFIIATILSYCKPTANREGWPIKIILYFGMVVSTIVIPNEPYFTPIYLIFAIGTIDCCDMHAANIYCLNGCFCTQQSFFVIFCSWWCHIHMSTTNRHYRLFVQLE